MKLTLFVLFCLLISVFAQDPQLLSVRRADGADPIGSLAGGTELELSVTGHTTLDKLQVLIGSKYPCVVKGDFRANETKIYCVTTQPVDFKVNLANLTVKLVNLEKGGQPHLDVTCGSCRYTYADSHTPVLKLITPNAAVAGTSIEPLGIWRVNDYADFKTLIFRNNKGDSFQCIASGSIPNQQTDAVFEHYITEDDLPVLGDNIPIDEVNLLNQFPPASGGGITQLEVQRKKFISRDSFVFLKCNLASTAVAGYYTLDINTSAGNPLDRQTQTDNFNYNNTISYQVAVIPQITKMSQNNIGTGGTVLQFEATGLPHVDGTTTTIQQFQERVKVVIGHDIKCNNLHQVPVVVGQPNPFLYECEIDDTDPTKMSYVDDDKTNQVHIEGQGVKYDVYDVSALNIGSAAQFRAYYQVNYQSMTPVTKGVQAVWERRMLTERQAVRMQGFFKAPRTGTYNFWVSGDDTVEVYFNHYEPNYSDPSVYLRNIVSKCGATNFREYFYSSECGYRSADQYINAGNYYWLEVWAFNGAAEGHVSLSVETPELELFVQENGQNVVPIGLNSVDLMQKVTIKPDSDYETWVVTVNNFVDDQNIQQAFGFEVRYSDTDVRKSPEYTVANWSASQVDDQLTWATKYDSLDVTEKWIKTDGANCDYVTETAFCTGKQFNIQFQSYRAVKADGNTYQFQLFTSSQAPNAWTKLENPHAGTSFKQQTKVQSPPVSGTYQLSYNGNKIVMNHSLPADDDTRYNINYDQYGAHIVQALKSVDFENNSNFQDYYYWRSGESGRKYGIWFRNRNNKGKYQEGLKLVKNNLVGGKLDTQPQVQIQTPLFKQLQTDTFKELPFIPATERPFYEPIPFDMAYTGSAKTSLKISVDGIQAQCTGDCSAYASPFTPVVKAFNVEIPAYPNKWIVNFTFGYSTNSADIRNKIINGKWFVTFATIGCRKHKIIYNKSSTNDISVTCTLNADPEGGHWFPKFWVDGYGFSVYGAGLIPHYVPLCILQLDPPSAGVYGGTQVTITGCGFSRRRDFIAITVDGSKAEVLQVFNSSQVIAVVPSRPNGNGGIVVGTLCGNTSPSSPIVYHDDNIPTIATVTPLSASPVLKGTIIITGTNFGTDRSKLKVWLFNLKIDFANVTIDSIIKNPKNEGILFHDLSITSSSVDEIVAVLEGGHVDKFYVVVEKKGTGYSSVINESVFVFEYVIRVSDVTPMTGSLHGGQVLTITGEHFSNNIYDNVIWLQPLGLNQEQNSIRCNILAEGLSTTQLKCKTVAIKQTDVSAYNLIVQGRLIEDSTCTGICQFVYDNLADSPIIDQNNTNQGTFKNGQTVVVTGYLLTSEFGVWLEVTSGQTNPVAFKTLIQGTYGSGNDVSFLFPDTIPAGQYLGEVIVMGKGSAGQFLLEILFAVDTYVQLYTFSTVGEDIIITGSGFHPLTTVVTLGDRAVYIREFNSATQIKLQLPNFTDSSTVFVVNHKIINSQFVGVEDYTQASFNVNFSKSVTPVAVGLAWEIGLHVIGVGCHLTQNLDHWPIHVAVQCRRYTYTAFTANGGTVDKTFLQSKLYSDTTFAAQDFSNTTSVFEDIPAGSYHLFVHVVGKGYTYFELPPIIHQYADQQLLHYISTIGPKFTTSLVGGSLMTLNGLGYDYQFVNRNSVKVCGFECLPITQNEFNQLTCRLPTLSTQYIHEHSTWQVADLDEIFKPINRPRPTYILTTHYNWIADNITHAPFARDGNSRSFYKGKTGADTCFVGWDFGTDWNVILETVHIHPKQGVAKADYEKIKGSLLQGSKDGIEWLTLSVVGDYICPQRNVFKFNWNKNNYYRYVRMFNDQDAQHSCEYSELYIWGWRFPNWDNGVRDDIVCNVEVDVNGQKEHYLNAVIYSQAQTPEIESITPRLGLAAGGQQITLTGLGFGIVKQDVQVFINGIVCTVTSVNNTQIKCNSGPVRLDCTEESTVAMEREVVVYIENMKAMKTDQVYYQYGLPYSETSTWGGEALPRQGDSIFVPKCQVLIVNRSTQLLNAVIVEGTIIFDGSQDINFNANYILIRGGKFIAGTSDNVFPANLNIILRGEYTDAQLPIFGNKVLGCHECVLQLHGQPRTPAYTTLYETALASTLVVNSNTIKTSQLTNWRMGDSIIITTTSNDRTETEERIISLIAVGGVVETKDVFNTDTNEWQTVSTSVGDILTLDKPLLKTHEVILAQQLSYGAEGNLTYQVRAEVANLTRNIVIQGAGGATVQHQYGAHVMIRGTEQNGTLAQFSHVEFKFTGQSRITNRYTINFQQNKDIQHSYVVGCSIHHAFGRMVALNDVSYLNIINNVGYRVRGHNIYLESGNEINNVIERNLIVSTENVFNMLSIDVQSAGIYITHPKNRVANNIVIGSEASGIQFEFKDTSSNGYCPSGSRVGIEDRPAGQIQDWDNNVTKANRRHGFRLFQLAPRARACSPLQEDYITNFGAYNVLPVNAITPFTISGFVAYKNNDAGILIELAGGLTFKNAMLVDNVKSGFQAHGVIYTPQFSNTELVLFQSVIYGSSKKGVICPRTHGFRVSNIAFHNFNQVFFVSSSLNDIPKLQTVGGKVYTLEKIVWFNSIFTAKIEYVGPRHNVFHDINGTLTEKSGTVYVTPYHPHHDKAIAQGGCQRVLSYTQNNNNCSYNIDNSLDHATDKYDDSIICTSTVRSISIGGIQPNQYFANQSMKIFNVNDETKHWGPNSQSWVSQNEFDEEKDSCFTATNTDGQDIDAPEFGNWAAMLATGYTYNIHWKQGLDFQRLIATSGYDYGANDPNTILRFNYTMHRETYDVENANPVDTYFMDKQAQSTLLSSLIDANNRPITGASRCSHGQWYLDNPKKLLYLCLSGKVKETPVVQNILNSVYCRDFCYSYTCGNDEKTTVEWEQGDTNGIFDPNNVNNFGKTGVVMKTTCQYSRQIESDPNCWEFRVPGPNDVLRVPCNWNLIVFQTVVEVELLLIDGSLSLKNNLSNAKQSLTATNIWVRGGSFLAGSETLPVSHTIKIFLKGTRNSKYLLINEGQESGTKTLAVSGKLSLQGRVLQLLEARLTLNALPGNKYITLDVDVQASNLAHSLLPLNLRRKLRPWLIGDELVLSASKIDGSGYEKVKIKSISGKRIYLESSIQYFHFGSAVAKTVDASTPDQLDKVLDMRTVVVPLTRDIQILGTMQQNFGGHLHVLWFKAHYYSELKALKAKESTMTAEQYQTALLALKVTQSMFRGNVQLKSVELSNMGQRDSDNAGLHFLETPNLVINDTITENNVSYFNFSTVHDCVGKCARIDNSFYINFTNSLFFNGYQSLLEVFNGYSINIQNSNFIGVQPTPGGASGFVSCLAVYQIQDPNQLKIFKTHQINALGLPHGRNTIRNNKVSGSTHVGMAFAGIPQPFRSEYLDETPNGTAGIFYNNIASHCGDAGAIFNNDNSQYPVVPKYNVNDGFNPCYLDSNGQVTADCQERFVNSEVKVFSSRVGIAVSTYKAFYEINNVMIVECGTGLTLRSGVTEDNNGKTNIVHENYIINSYISAYATDGKKSTFNYDSTYCKNNFAIQLHVTTQTGAVIGGFYYEIRSPPIPFSSVFIKDTIFVNYGRVTGKCTNNFVFTTNENAADATAAHFLDTTQCLNCNEKNWVKWTEPKAQWAGWQGGCGSKNHYKDDLDGVAAQCTGLKNTIIQDMTGNFLRKINNVPQPFDALIPKNSNLSSLCKGRAQATWNGYYCQADATSLVPHNVGILAWDAIGDDRLLNENSIVTIQNSSFKKSGAVYQTQINQYREWSWRNNEPENKRPNTFVSFIRFGEKHIIQYSGQQCWDMIHKIQHQYPVNLGLTSQFFQAISIEYQYNNSMSIDVYNVAQPGSLPIRSVTFTTTTDTISGNTSCGANRYTYSNRTIHFVQSDDPQCQIRVVLKNVVQVNLRLAMSFDDFYAAPEVTQTNFIDRISAFLKIPTYKLKIVGVVERHIATRRIIEVVADGEIKEEQQIESDLIIQILGDQPTLDASYSPIEQFLQLLELVESLQQGLENEDIKLEWDYVNMEYKIIVAKKPGDKEEDFFTEDDLPKEDENKEEEENEKKLEKNPNIFESDTLSLPLIICIAAACLILVVLIVMKVLHMQKQKKNKKVAEASNNGDENKDVAKINKSIIDNVIDGDKPNEQNTSIQVPTINFNLIPDMINKMGNKKEQQIILGENTPPSNDNQLDIISVQGSVANTKRGLRSGRNYFSSQLQFGSDENDTGSAETPNNIRSSQNIDTEGNLNTQINWMNKKKRSRFAINFQQQKGESKDYLVEQNQISSDEQIDKPRSFNSDQQLQLKMQQVEIQNHNVEEQQEQHQQSKNYSEQPIEDNLICLDEE